MLNSTFVDEPDTSDERREAALNVKTIDNKDEDSEFICEWIDVQEEPKWLILDEIESEKKWGKRRLVPAGSFPLFEESKGLSA